MVREASSIPWVLQPENSYFHRTPNGRPVASDDAGVESIKAHVP